MVELHRQRMLHLLFLDPGFNSTAVISTASVGGGMKGLDAKTTEAIQIATAYVPCDFCLCCNICIWIEVDVFQQRSNIRCVISPQKKFYKCWFDGKRITGYSTHEWMNYFFCLWTWQDFKRWNKSNEKLICLHLLRSHAIGFVQIQLLSVASFNFSA